MDISPFKLINYTSQKSKTVYPIYCVKFCPYTDDLIFAAAILNKVDIYQIKDGDKIMKLRTFEAKKDEYFYALDWTVDDKTDEILLIGGGMKGKLYNFHKASIFGAKFREKTNAINDILFSPKINYLFAAAYEDGSVCLYNLKSEICIAICMTQRANSMKQTISISFDPSGNHLAYGGMTNEIFIVNLKDCEDLQDNLKQSLMFEKEIAPVRLNLLHKMCVIQNLHSNYVDAINWYAESSVMTKSASGDIILWHIKGIEKQDIPFKNDNCLKLVKQLCINIDNCNLWFIRFSFDPLLKYLTIGKCNGELVLWDIQNDSFSKWKYHSFEHKFSNSTIRQSSFSNNGKYLVCCTDDGFLITYAKSDIVDSRVVKKGSNKKTKKS